MSDQQNGGGEGPILIAEYVLGLLDPAEHAIVGRRVAADPEWRSEAALWQSRLSDLDDGFAEEPAPAQIFRQIERRLFPDEAPTTLAKWWNQIAVWRGLAGAALAVAIVAVGFAVLRPVTVSPQLLTTLSSDAGAVTYVALYDRAAGDLRVSTVNRPGADGHDLELWAIQGTDAPQSLGVIPATAGLSIHLPAATASRFGAGTVLAISVEPIGGSPSGAPTGPVIAKGAATEI